MTARTRRTSTIRTPEIPRLGTEVVRPAGRASFLPHARATSPKRPLGSKRQWTRVVYQYAAGVRGSVLMAMGTFDVRVGVSLFPCFFFWHGECFVFLFLTPELDG